MNNKVKFLRGTSNEYAVAEKDSDTIYFTTDDGKLYIGDKEVSGDGSVTIDDTLSDTSTNPVQNKVVKQAIDNKADKTVATTETDGLMSASDKGKLDAFEITAAGGKLHDKDIATIDDIPTSLPANGGNADTVDGLHATDFVNANIGQIQIPSNVDVPVWIFTNGKRYQQYMTNGGNVGLTNVPNNAGDYVWYWYDGINIIACEWVTNRYYICSMINGYFSGWKDVYTSGFKPYVTGYVPISEDGKCYTNHGFTPSVVLYNVPYTTTTLMDNVYKSTKFDTTSFTPLSGASGSSINYIIFR